MQSSNRFVSNLKGVMATIAVSAAFVVAGCAEEIEESTGTASEALPRSPPNAQEVDQPDEQAPYFADVSAIGRGCPRGSVVLSITDDRSVFTMTFSQFFVELDASTRSSVNDCTISIKLRSPSGVSYAVSDFVYEGYAAIAEGVRAFQTARYYFQGDPIKGVEKRTDLTGPYDDVYSFQDTIRTVDAVWSPCGLNRNLQILTRIGAQKVDPASRGGMMTLASLDGSTQGKIVLKLAYRACDANDDGRGTSRDGMRR